MATDSMTVKITPNDTGNPVGKLADAELHFTGGPLEGLKLIGFAIWGRRGGSGRNVTFPARQYSVNGDAMRVLGRDGWMLRSANSPNTDPSDRGPRVRQMAFIRLANNGQLYDRSGLHHLCLRLTPGQSAASRPPP